MSTDGEATPYREIPTDGAAVLGMTYFSPGCADFSIFCPCGLRAVDDRPCDGVSIVANGDTLIVNFQFLIIHSKKAPFRGRPGGCDLYSSGSSAGYPPGSTRALARSFSSSAATEAEGSLARNLAAMALTAAAA